MIVGVRVCRGRGVIIRSSDGVSGSLRHSRGRLRVGGGKIVVSAVYDDVLGVG